ncbi:MAG: hypothetical protein ACKO2Z_35245, partial [Sphaerospermopsis kisseleviana]
VSYLENILKGKADVRFNGPITLSNSEPEPDIAIVKLPESKYDQHHPYADDIFWLIEVANTILVNITGSFLGKLYLILISRISV